MCEVSDGSGYFMGLGFGRWAGLVSQYATHRECYRRGGMAIISV